MAVCPVLAVADLLTGFPVKPRSTCLVAVESRPTRFAGALARHGVTALGVMRMAGTLFVTLDPIHSLWTQSDLAVLTVVASLTKAGTAYMVALPSVHTLTCLGTVYSVRSKRAFFLAPLSSVSWAAVTLTGS